jgi:predicted heme/steroid binding protein
MANFGLIASAITLLFGGTIHIFHDSINLYMMGFFRDLSRIKARKRRMKNTMAISPTSTGRNSKNEDFSMDDFKMLFFKTEEDDPLKDVEIHFDIDSNGNLKTIQNDNANNSNNSNNSNNDSSSSSASSIIDDESSYTDLAEYTREELYEFGNGDNEEEVLLLSLYGRVYDVSEGYKYYGEGGKYHAFAGRDVTRALSTGCMADSCLGPKHTLSSASLSDSSGNNNDKAYANDHFELTPKIIAEGKKWISFFETHDSYHLVGILKDGRSIDDLVDEEIEMEEEVEL